MGSYRSPFCNGDTDALKDRHYPNLKEIMAQCSTIKLLINSATCA